MAFWKSRSSALPSLWRRLHQPAPLRLCYRTATKREERNNTRWKWNPASFRMMAVRLPRRSWGDEMETWKRTATLVLDAMNMRTPSKAARAEEPARNTPHDLEFGVGRTYHGMSVRGRCRRMKRGRLVYLLRRAWASGEWPGHPRPCLIITVIFLRKTIFVCIEY